MGDCRGGSFAPGDIVQWPGEREELSPYAQQTYTYDLGSRPVYFIVHRCAKGFVWGYGGDLPHPICGWVRRFDKDSVFAHSCEIICKVDLDDSDNS